MATILVVDDLKANRDVLVTLLRYQGHRLVEAVDGSRALAVAREERPDLVITDVLMPVMDGYEFVRQLRLDPVTAAIPVVFSTAHYGEREARALALSSGVAYVLTKPTEPEEVLRIVGRVLSGAEPGAPLQATALTPDFDREHLRLVTDKLSEKDEDLRMANARLRALVNIGLELASERDADRLLRSVCTSARDLFGATYVTLGVLFRSDRTLQRLVASGTDTGGWMQAGDAPTGILDRVITGRKVLRGNNPSGGPIALDLPPSHPEIRAYVAAPVASPSHVYGWLCLVRNDGGAFTEEDEHLAKALAGQVGRIYENGYFYGVAQKRADDLQREVTERKQGEAALRDERDRAQRYLDTAEVILLALDRDGRVTLINRHGCSILGWTQEELLGRDWIDTCLPLSIRHELRRKLVVLLGDDLSVVEHPIVTRSGEERIIEWRNTVVRDESGRAMGTFSSGTDITERTQAVEALRSAEERTGFALQNAQIGIWDMDYATGVLRWSEIIEGQYGWAPGAFPGTFEAFTDRIHPEDRTPMLAAIEQAMRSGIDFTVKNRALWPDGTVRWLEGAGRVLLNEAGQPIRGVGISQDVTERRTLEAQYQQAQKMEAIGRLAGGVAHDFNNLLTAILGYCELLQADFSPNDPRRADVAEIQKAGTSAAGLTRQLLAFSRKQIIEPTLLDLNHVVSDLRTMLGRLIGEDVKINLALRPEIGTVKADRGQVEQIVVNLAVNARDAMPKGGTLTIETENVDLDEAYAQTHFSATPGPYVSLTVTDTGTGMTPQVQARLFEPFFTTKEIGKGTGLGLATVHGIVARSGGSVGVYSEVGRGTSFVVYLPRVDGETAPAVPTAAMAEPATVTQTVLVVDDSEGVRQLAKRLLERQGYRVLVAANATDALQVFEQNPSIDVLLTDVVMPGASGSDLNTWLTARRPDLKVIYMSGYTEEAIVQHGVLNPGIAFLHKPFTSETLGRKVRDVCER